MSKSLKNFITIRDFLSDGYGSSAPATDFRIFCLLHKYSASVHFSTEKIQEASLYRQRLTQFLSLCHTVEVSMTDRVTKSRPTEQSMQLHRAMDKYHTEIRALLEDDFDTPSVMRSLLYLVKEASVYAALLLGTDVHAFGTHPVEPLIQARGQILKILTLFGIDQSGLGVGIETNSSSKQHQQYMQQSSSVTLEKALDSLTQFRSRVRNQCLTEIKNIKKMKKEGNNTIANPSSSSSSPSSELLSIQGSMSSSNTSSNEALNSYERRLQSILTLCDQMRDDELVRMGVKIDDLNNTISTWKLIDTSPSHSSNIDNNDNRAS